MKTIKNKEKFNYLKSQKMSMVQKNRDKYNRKMVKPIPLIDAINMFIDGTFDKQQSKYLADSKAQTGNTKLDKESYFDAFAMHMVKDGPLKTKDSILGWVNDTWKISGIMHVDIDIKKDEWTENLFSDIWDRLKSTKPLFMYRSPNGGIKCFWVTDLENNDFNKGNFQNIVQLQIRKICVSLGILRFYDKSPTDPARISYAAGTKIDGKDYFYSDLHNYEILKTKKSVSAMKAYQNKKAEIEASKDLIHKSISNDSEETAFYNLPDKLKESIIDKSENALSEAIRRSVGTGYNRVWSLLGQLSGFGLDYDQVYYFVSRFHSDKGSKANWAVREKVDAFYSTYPDTNRDGGFALNTSGDGKHTQELRELNDRLANIVARLKDYTGEDNSAPFTLSSKYLPLIKMNFLDNGFKPDPLSNSNEMMKSGISNNVVKMENNNSKLDLGDLSSKIITAYKGFPGVGKSWKLLGEAANYLYMKRVIIYVVPDTASMSVGIKGSRYNDLIKRIHTAPQIPKNNKEKLNKQVSTVFYDAEDKSQSVSQQFDCIIDNLPKNEGKVIFITTEALKLVHLSRIPKNSVLMIDDSNELPQTELLSTWQKEEVDSLKKYIVFEGKGDCLKVKTASKEGGDYLEKNKDKGDKHPMYRRIEAAKKSVKGNVDQYYIISERKNGYSVYRADILSSAILGQFSEIFFAGDEIEYNPYLIMWKNAGAKIKYEDLPNKYKGIDSRLTIHYVTEHGYSKTKMKTHPSIPIKLASVISKKFVNIHKYTLLCMNLDQKDQVGALESGLSKAFKVTPNSPNTKGKNDLKHNTLVINAFKCDLPNDIKSVLSHITGIEMDEIETFLHRNLLMQNLFRGILRDLDSSANCDYIAPCKKDAEYLQGRLLEYGFKVEIKLLDKDLSDMFISGKRGAIPKNGIAMTSSERKQKSTLRQKYGEDVDGFDPKFLLPKMKGLRGRKADAKFLALKKELSAKVISFEDMKQKMTALKSYDQDMTEVPLDKMVG